MWIESPTIGFLDGRCGCGKRGNGDEMRLDMRYAFRSVVCMVWMRRRGRVVMIVIGIVTREDNREGKKGGGV